LGLFDLIQVVLRFVPMPRLPIVTILVCALAVPAQASDPIGKKAGSCPGTGMWGANSACIYNGVNKIWHCPWESMMTCSNTAYHGCKFCYYDCEQTNVDAILANYDTPPPEGTPSIESYIKCCITKQCKEGKSAAVGAAECGTPPYAGRLFDAYLPNMMKSTSGVAALAAGVLAFVMVTAGVACAVMRIRRPSLRAVELDEEASADSGLE